MEIINNRYRILETEYSNRIFSSHIAKDILSPNEEVFRLFLARPQMMTGVDIPKIIADFQLYSTIVHPYIVKDEHVDMVFSIDRKIVERTCYYYFIVEKFDYTTSFLDYAYAQTDADVLLDKFIEILKIFDLMIRRGFCYDFISTEHIYVDENQNIKIKDFITAQIESITYSSHDKRTEIKYRAPEMYTGEKATASSVIYALGTLLKNLLKNPEFETVHGAEIKPIADRMTTYRHIERYASIVQVIEDINFFCLKNYAFIFEDKNYYIYTKPGLLVRDSVRNAILKNANKIKDGNNGVYIYEIKGYRNTGKTKVLRDIRKQLSLNGVDIFASFDEDRILFKNSGIFPVVSKVLSERGYDIIQKYEKVGEFLQNGNCEKDDYTSYSQITTFIKDAIDEQITAIIIDDLRSSDTDTIEIIRYLQYDRKLKEKILIIYTSEDEISLEKTETYVLNNLTIAETSRMIKSILCVDYNPIDIATRIYKDTTGNVKYVKKIVLNLIEQNVLEFDNKGNWIFKSDKYDDLKIMEDSFDSPHKYLEEFNFIQQETIINLSFFKNPSTVDDVAVMLSDIRFSDVVNNLTELVNENVFVTKFSDDGYYYEFEDRLFKKKVYTSIPEDLKIEKHRNIAENIINSKKLSNERFLDELIYHLKKAKYHKEASIYIIKKAEDYFDTRSLAENIEIYEDAIIQAILSKDEIMQITAYHRAGNVCFKEGMLDKANGYFKASLDIAKSIDNYKVVFVSLNRIAEVYLKIKDFVNAKDVLDEIKSILQRYKSNKAQLDYHVLMISYLTKGAEHETALEWIEKTEKLCEGKYKKHYAWALYYKGIIYCENVQHIDKLIPLHETMLDLFTRVKDKDGIIFTYNSLGFVYAEFFMNNEKAIHYFKLMKIEAEANRLALQVSIANFNLGVAVLRNLNYEEAIGYFNKSVESATLLKRRDLVFGSYVYLAYIMIDTLEFLNADTYIKKAEYLLDDSIKYDRAVVFYHEVKALFCMYVGDKELAQKHIKAIKDSPVNVRGFQKATSSTLHLLAGIQKVKSKDESESILRELFERSKELKDYPYVMKRFLDLAFLAKYFYNWMLINDIYEWAIENVDVKESERAKNIQEYMRAYLNPSNTRTECMEAIASRLDLKFDMRLLFQVNFTLGEDYINQKKYFLGVSYLFENYINIKDRMYNFSEDTAMDSFLGSMLTSIIVSILYIEDLNLFEITQIDIYNPSEKTMKIMSDKNEVLKILLKEKTFTDEARKYLNWDIGEFSTDYIIENLTYSNIGNIEFLLKHLMSITWAQSGGVYLRQDKEINCISWINDIGDTKELEMIFNQVDIVQDRLIVSEFVENVDDISRSILPSQAKGFMCIPIFTDSVQRNDRRTVKNKILGYVYLETKMVINSFTEDSFAEIEKFINLLSTYIENYNLSLKYSIDKLTQAYNRQYFDVFIKNELESAQIQKSMFSLVLMDIDFFKSVNDNFGHGFGDITLKTFTKIVQSSIRGTDLFARYGGEEFILFLKNTAAPGAYVIADRIRERISRELKDPEGKPITASMGIATYPEHGGWEEELIHNADIALYNAKTSGRNRVCLWDNTLNSSEIFERKKENVLASIFGENHHRINLFINSVNLIKSGDGEKKEDFDKYIMEAVNYFEAEKIFIVKFEKNEINSLLKVTLDGATVIKRGFDNHLNTNVVKTCYDEEKSLYLTDWEQASKLDVFTGMPEWDSVLSVPIVYKGKKKGVLYISAPARIKEFTIIDSSVAQIIAPIIGDFM